MQGVAIGVKEVESRDYEDGDRYGYDRPRAHGDHLVGGRKARRREAGEAKRGDPRLSELKL